MENNLNKLIKYENPEFLAKYDKLNDIDKVKTYTELRGKSGIYSFINLIDGKQYIGSANNLYTRLLHHVKGVQSNVKLQNAMDKYGRENFIFVIYAYAPYVLPDILELENKYINNFALDRLYNILQFATSSLGFKHSAETRARMRERLLIPNNNPRLKGDAHPNFYKKGELSHMWGKKLSAETRALLSSKHMSPVTLFDINKVYILTFKNKQQLSEFIGCGISTLTRCLASGELVKKKYYCKKD